MNFKIINSPLSEILLTGDGDFLTRIDFFEDLDESEIKTVSSAVLEETEKFLFHYFNKIESKRPKIKLTGTPFQERIWEILLEIPFGKSLSYGEVAKEYENRYEVKKMSPQAVGTAIGKNPLPIIIPCHRVIKADGSLGGFSRGLYRKEWLLNHEKIYFK